MPLEPVEVCLTASDRSVAHRLCRRPHWQLAAAPETAELRTGSRIYHRQRPNWGVDQPWPGAAWLQSAAGRHGRMHHHQLSGDRSQDPEADCQNCRRDRTGRREPARQSMQAAGP